MMKKFSVALATTALIALAAPLAAQDKSGTNFDAAAPAAAPGGATQAALAQDLYAIGMANSDPLTVLAAAKLAASVAFTDVEREMETTGEEVADGPDAADAPKDAAAMFADAKALAGEDETLVGLIEDAEAEGSRGRIGGASRTLSRMPGGRTDVFKVPFYGNSYAEVAVIGDGDSNLNVLITDENRNTICYDVSWSDKVYCNFTPAWNGYFYITVQNTGRSRNSYYLLTN